MIYGKIVDKNVKFATQTITIGESRVINPTPEQYKAAGYLPVERTDAPVAEDGYHAVPRWEQTAEAIVQVWDVVKDESVPPSLEDEVDALILEVADLRYGGGTV